MKVDASRQLIARHVPAGTLPVGHHRVSYRLYRVGRTCLLRQFWHGMAWYGLFHWAGSPPSSGRCSGRKTHMCVKCLIVLNWGAMLPVS